MKPYDEVYNVLAQELDDVLRAFARQAPGFASREDLSAAYARMAELAEASLFGEGASG
jgi:hypothetical protein